MIFIRPEKEGDFSSLVRLYETTFGKLSQAKLLKTLQVSVHPYVSLIAELDDRIIGHILFTPGTIEGRKIAMRLGPLVVLPRYQRRGVGSRLVRYGLEACKENEEKVVFVVGKKDFFSRFGFSSAGRLGFYCSDAKKSSDLLVKKLEKGRTKKLSGEVRFHPVYDRVDVLV